jgi:hypothetical protein
MESQLRGLERCCKVSASLRRTAEIHHGIQGSGGGGRQLDVALEQQRRHELAEDVAAARAEVEQAAALRLGRMEQRAAALEAEVESRDRQLEVAGIQAQEREGCAGPEARQGGRAAELPTHAYMQ